MSKNKTGGYLATIKAELATVTTKANRAQARLQEAQAEQKQATREFEALESKAAHLPWTEEQENAQLRVRAADQRLRGLTSEAQELASERDRLQNIVEAPRELENARARLADLIRQQADHHAAATRSEEIVTALAARAAALAEENEAECKAAAEEMAAGRSGEVPESLTRREIEARITKAAHAVAVEKRAAVAALLSEVADQIQEARDQVQAGQAAVAEIEVQELITAHIGAFARAALARRGFGGRADQYTVAIPPDALEAACAALAID